MFFASWSFCRRARPVARRFLLPLLSLSVAAACARSPESAAVPFVPPSGLAARVYVAVFDSLVRDSATGPIVVPEVTVVFRAPAGVPSTWAEYEQVPAGLAAHLETVSSRPQPTARLPLPRPVQVLSAAEFESIRLAQPRDWWAEFRKRFPGQAQVLSFSPIAFTNDSTTALVEFVQGCGATCGSGRLVWLERAPDDRWTVRRTYPLWYN